MCVVVWGTGRHICIGIDVPLISVISERPRELDGNEMIGPFAMGRRIGIGVATRLYFHVINGPQQVVEVPQCDGSKGFCRTWGNKKRIFCGRP